MVEKSPKVKVFLAKAKASASRNGFLERSGNVTKRMRTPSGFCVAYEN